MKNKKQNHPNGFILNTLTVSMMLLSSSVYALQAMDDGDLRAVNGQDGVHIATTFDEANIDALYWTDKAGRGTSGTNQKQELTATAEQVRISKSNVASVTPGTDLKLNMGSEAGKTGVDLKLAVNPMLLTVGSFRVCNSDNGTTACSPDIGDLAVQTTSDLNFELKTRDGLMSKTSQSELVLGVKNANIYLGQTDVNNELNQLILKNMNFNFVGKGYMFVDAQNGFVLKTNSGADAILGTTPNQNYGYVDFIRVADSASGKTGFINTGTYGSGNVTTGSGLNLEFLLNSNVDKSSPYALDPLTNTPANTKGLIRVGASGRMVNGQLQLRGLTTAGTTDPLGKADSPNGTSGNNIMGDSGIAFRMKADFTKDGDSMLGADGKATTLEIGGAGLNSYGFEFSNLTGLQANTRGSFDSGNVYLNLIDTKNALLPENYTFQTSRFGNNSFLTTSADYKQNIHNLSSNPYAVMMSIRGGEFQAISRRGRFTTSAGVTDPTKLFSSDGMNNDWGLALPFYNLNANMAMYGAKVPANTAYYFTDNGKRNQVSATSAETSRLGFSLAMSTQGIDGTLNGTQFVKKGDKTTSILVIDGGKYTDKNNVNKTTDYYMGLRNVDMLLKGDGTIGVEKGSVNIGLKHMLIVMAAEVAAGYLPGTTYKSCAMGISTAAAACANKSIVSTNNFALPDDVLFGAKLRLGGDIDFSLIPNNSISDGGKMSIVGELTLANTGNTIQISDPVNGSTIGLDNLTGKIGFNNAIVLSKDQPTGLGKVGFNSTFNFNPDQTAAGVFKAKDLNFYPPNTGTGARLGEIAITGGRLKTEFGIIPR